MEDYFSRLCKLCWKLSVCESLHHLSFQIVLPQLLLMYNYLPLLFSSQLDPSVPPPLLPSRLYWTNSSLSTLSSPHFGDEHLSHLPFISLSLPWGCSTSTEMEPLRKLRPSVSGLHNCTHAQTQETNSKCQVSVGINMVVLPLDGCDCIIECLNYVQAIISVVVFLVWTYRLVQITMFNLYFRNQILHE